MEPTGRYFLVMIIISLATVCFVAVLLMCFFVGFIQLFFIFVLFYLPHFSGGSVEYHCLDILKGLNYLTKNSKDLELNTC